MKSLRAALMWDVQVDIKQFNLSWSMAIGRCKWIPGEIGDMVQASFRLWAVVESRSISKHKIAHRCYYWRSVCYNTIFLTHKDSVTPSVAIPYKNMQDCVTSSFKFEREYEHITSTSLVRWCLIEHMYHLCRLFWLLLHWERRIGEWLSNYSNR